MNKVKLGIAGYLTVSCLAGFQTASYSLWKSSGEGSLDNATNVFFSTARSWPRLLLGEGIKVETTVENAKGERVAQHTTRILMGYMSYNNKGV